MVPAPCIQPIDNKIAPKLNSKSLKVLLEDLTIPNPFLGLMKNM